MANNVTVNGKTYDLSTQSGRADARTDNPNLIVDASSVYNPGSGQQTNATSGGTTVNAPTNNTANPGAGLDSLLQAAQRGDKETFEKTLNEQMREWNDKYGLDLKQFDESIRQYNQNFGVTQAGLTGQYQGAPTMQLNAQNAQLYGTAAPTAGQATLAAQQQNYAQQMGLIAQASALQANPFRQQQALGQMSGLLGGNGLAGFAAPNTVAGVGVAGGNTQGGMGYLRQMIDDIRDPNANAASMNQVLAGIPTPNKLNSTEFLRAAPSTQSMVLQGMSEKYGIDPNDALAQIKNTLPQFQAPTTVGTVKR